MPAGSDGAMLYGITLFYFCQIPVACDSEDDSDTTRGQGEEPLVNSTVLLGNGYSLVV